MGSRAPGRRSPPDPIYTPIDETSGQDPHKSVRCQRRLFPSAALCLQPGELVQTPLPSCPMPCDDLGDVATAVPHAPCGIHPSQSGTDAQVPSGAPGVDSNQVRSRAHRAIPNLRFSRPIWVTLSPEVASVSEFAVCLPQKRQPVPGRSATVRVRDREIRRDDRPELRPRASDGCGGPQDGSGSPSESCGDANAAGSAMAQSATSTTAAVRGLRPYS